MADATRKPILDRLAALVAGPFLLGREALSVTFRPAQDAPPEPPPGGGSAPHHRQVPRTRHQAPRMTR